MIVWPLYTNNNEDVAAVVLATAAMVVTLALATVRGLTYSRKARSRDLAMIGVHLTSALSAFGFILLHCYYDDSDIGLCRFTVSMWYSGEYLRRSLICVIYYLRLNELIGLVYPKWLRYVALGPIFVMLISWLVSFDSINTPGGVAEIYDGNCGGMEQHVTSFLIEDACLILVVIGGLSLVCYLLLFLVPLLKYSIEYIGSANRKRFLITVVDIFAELVFLLLLIGGEHAATVWVGLALLYLGLICGNVLLIFVYADWRRCFCMSALERMPSIEREENSGINLTTINDNVGVEDLEEQLLSPNSDTPPLVLS